MLLALLLPRAVALAVIRGTRQVCSVPSILMGGDSLRVRGYVGVFTLTHALTDWLPEFADWPTN